MKGGLKELGWGKNPTEGKLKVGLAETKSDKKKSVWGDFAEYGNLIYPRAFLCFTRQGCENQGKEHYMQDMEENKGLSYQSTVYFSHKELFHKGELVFKQVLALRVQVYQS